MQLVRFLLLVLLAGYFLLNKSFALLGIGPVYVGEFALTMLVVVSFFDLRKFWIEPLRRSWLARITLALLVYGAARVLVDAAGQSRYGAPAIWLVMRDGVCIAYALFALLAPPVLESSLVRALATLAPLTLIWVFCNEHALWPATYPGWIADRKPDMLSLSVLVSAWVAGVLAWKCVRNIPAKGSTLEKLRDPWWRRALMMAVISVLSVLLALSMRTRAAWLAILLVIGFVLALNARRLMNRYTLGLAVVMMALIWWLALPAFMQSHAPGIERIKATLGFELPTLVTGDARDSELNVEWRSVFWRRCIAQTFQRAPFFGLGFGMNLTDLMRDTPDWWRYVQSQQMNPPNRNPHNAWVTILTRSGLIGFTLFAALMIGAAIVGFNLCRLSPEPVHGRALILFGVWLIYVSYMSVGDVIENPFGGIWLWVLTGSIAALSTRRSPTTPADAT